MQNYRPIPPRRSAIQTNPYRIDQRSSSSRYPLDPSDEIDLQEEPTRTRTSAVRYVDRQGNEVIQRGNKRFVIHDDELPPTKKRHPHWLVISGLSMIVLVFLWASLSWLSSWWTEHTLDTTYQFPRISQADAVVYPGDSSQHPSHYLFLNLNGTVLIIELPHGDEVHAHIYKGPTIFSDNADQIPITGEFRVVNGKVEMLVHIQDRIILYINNGTEFVSQ